jgi:hypothetical protein
MFDPSMWTPVFIVGGAFLSIVEVATISLGEKIDDRLRTAASDGRHHKAPTGGENHLRPERRRA